MAPYDDGMKRLLLVACLACPVTTHAAERSYINEFYDARAIEKTDPEAASTAMIRCFHHAVDAGNADYATAAGLSASYLILNRNRIVEAGKLAREVIVAIDALPANEPKGDILRRGQLFGLAAKGLAMEGRIGEALRTCHATAETLRGKKVSTSADGPPITLAEVLHMDPQIRSLGWRLVREEADMLDKSGRTLDARALLDSAAATIRNEWTGYPSNEQFYAFKLLAARAMTLDFLGYEREALQIQRDLSTTGADIPALGASWITLQLNMLRNVSQWDGPSEEILTQARASGTRLKALGDTTDVDRLLAKMELDLHDSQQALDALRANADRSTMLGNLYDAVYAERDSLIARAAQGESSLDSEFTRLLGTMRAMGNKRGEPTLYRQYGLYLMQRKRPAEAVVMLAEALRLTRSFGWTLHEPNLIYHIFNARFTAGDVAGARATLAELDDFLANHPDLPDYRRVPAETSRALALARLGDPDAAKASLALALAMAKDLPAYQKRLLTPEAQAGILRPTPADAVPTSSPASVPAVAAQTPALHVHPLEVTSIAAPGKPARTRFTLFNPSAASIEGQWLIHGPGAAATKDGASISFDAAKAPESVRVPRCIRSGDQNELGVSIAAGAGVETGKVTLAWQAAGQVAGPESTWEAHWDAAAIGGVVLDASSLEASPFRFVSLFHELALPPGEELGIPFRMRSPVPLRLEYYNARTQQLLAIDANGNGDFTEAGDLHLRGPGGVAAAIVPPSVDGSNITVEVHLFATTGEALPPTDPALMLVAEIHRDGAWVREAEDTLK